MSFIQENSWRCVECENVQHSKDEPTKCYKPECPSNKPKTTLPRLILERKPYSENVVINNELDRIASDAGFDGKIVGLTKDDVEKILSELPKFNLSDKLIIFRKKLEAE